MNTNTHIKITETPAAITISFGMYTSMRKEKDVFYIKCDVLDIHSQGYTEQEAKVNIADAIQLFFESCYERGVLTEALKELGFELHKERIIPVPEESENSDSVMIHVPLQLLAANHVEQNKTH